MKRRAFLLSSLYYPNVGGVENSLKEFSFILKDKGYDVTVITSDRDSVTYRTLPELDCLDDVKVIRCHYPFGAFGFLVFLKSVCKKIKELNINNSDLIISRSHWPVISLRLCGIKNINYIAPSVHLLEEKVNLGFIFKSKMLRHVVNSIGQSFAFFVSNVFVFSEDMVRQVKTSTLGFCTPYILNPGVSRSRFHYIDDEEKASLRDSLGLDESVTYLLCVGRLSEIKQFDIAIRSLKYLDESYHLLIVGSGPELEFYETLCDSEGVSERVTIFPFTDDIDLFYKISDIYLMTSRYESFGQVLLEATSCGLPVVAFSKSSGVRTSVSYIYKGFDSLLVECDDQSPLSLAQRIVELKPEIKKLEVEISRFCEKYSWGSAIERIILNGCL